MFSLHFRIILLVIAYAMGHPISKVKPTIKSDASNTLTGFDCTDLSSEQTIVSLLNQGDCVMSTGNITTQVVPLKIFQKQAYEKIRYSQCFVSIDTTITRCGKWYEGRNMFIKSYNTMPTPTKWQCEDMIKNELYINPLMPHIKVDLKTKRGKFNGIVKGTLHESSCDGTDFVDDHGETYHEVYVHMEITVHINEGEAALNLQDQILILANGLKCSFVSRTCFDVDHGQTFWDIGYSHNDCFKKPLIKIFDGMVNKTTELTHNNQTKVSYYSIDGQRLFFIQALHEVSICNYRGFISQHPDIYTIESQDFHRSFVQKTDYSIKNVDALILSGMQLSMMYNDIAVQMTNLYNTVQYQKCLSDAKIISTTLSLAKLDPNSLGLSIFNQPGYFTKLSGEVAYILKCQPHMVKIRKSHGCFNEIPIFYDEKEAYLSPRSRLIVEKGTTVECDDFFPSVFNLNNRWFLISDGKLQSTSPPKNVEVSQTNNWNFLPVKDIGIRGIYSPEDVEGWKNSVNEPLSQLAQEKNLYSLLTGKPGAKWSDSSILSILATTEFNDAVTRITEPLSFFKNRFIDLGQFVSGCIGIFVIFKAVKFVLNLMFNTYLLNETFGCSFLQLFAWWDSVTHYLIYNHAAKKKESEKNTENYHKDALPVVTTQPITSTNDEIVFAIPNAPSYQQLHASHNQD